jgi:hypothetical protein
MFSSTPFRKTWTTFLLLATVGWAWPAQAPAQHLYWADSDGIHRARVDGSQVQTLVTEGGFELYWSHLALDLQSGHLYWSIPGCAGWCIPYLGEIRRVNIDGTAAGAILADPEFSIFAFALDPLQGRLYWGGQNYGDLIYGGALSTANVDGSGFLRLLSYPEFVMPHAIAIDPVDQVLFWSGLDGTHCAPVDDLASGDNLNINPSHLTVDAMGRRLYWSEGNRIMRSHLDGAGAEVVVTLIMGNAGQIAVDPLGQRLYWTSHESSGQDSIWGANLDGTDIELILSIQYIGGIAIDPRPTGDFNMDGLVTREDHDRLIECLAGPAAPLLHPACAFFDYDTDDGTVDLADYAGFQNTFTGSE